MEDGRSGERFARNADRGDCGECELSAPCLSMGIPGLRTYIEGLCPHCFGIWLKTKNGGKRRVYMNCGAFMVHYGRQTMRMLLCEECAEEMEEMYNLMKEGSKDAAASVSGSTERVRKEGGKR